MSVYVERLMHSSFTAVAARCGVLTCLLHCPSASDSFLYVTSELSLPATSCAASLALASFPHRKALVSASVLSMLRVYKAHQAEQRLKLGSAWNPAWTEHPRLFTQLDGTPINPDSVTKCFMHSLRGLIYRRFIFIACGTRMSSTRQKIYLGKSRNPKLPKII